MFDPSALRPTVQVGDQRVHLGRRSLDERRHTTVGEVADPTLQVTDARRLVGRGLPEPYALDVPPDQQPSADDVHGRAIATPLVTFTPRHVAGRPERPPGLGPPEPDGAAPESDAKTIPSTIWPLMPSTDVVSLDATTITLHGAGHSDAHEVTMRKADIGSVAVGSSWHLPSVAVACFLGVLTAVPLVLAHLVTRWLIQGTLVAIVMGAASVALFWAARRAELVVRTKSGDAAFVGHYPPWRSERCLAGFRALETVMGRRERFVPHPVDARIQLLWRHDGVSPATMIGNRSDALPTTVAPRPGAATGPPRVSQPTTALLGATWDPSAARNAPVQDARDARDAAGPATPRHGNPWFQHILPDDEA